MERKVLCGSISWKAVESSKKLACMYHCPEWGVWISAEFDHRNEYSGTWIAANLKISMPTPKSHPDFPLWDCGYTEEEIFDLFWPPGFQYVYAIRIAA
jgi:hypothetical protein